MYCYLDLFYLLQFIDWSWYFIFSPLFISQSFSAYFSVIVFIRMLERNDFRTTLTRLAWSLISLGLVVVFELLYCKKLDGEVELKYSSVFGSLYCLMALLLLRSCKVN